MELEAIRPPPTAPPAHPLPPLPYSPPRRSHHRTHSIQSAISVVSSYESHASRLSNGSRHRVLSEQSHCSHCSAPAQSTIQSPRQSLQYTQPQQQQQQRQEDDEEDDDEIDALPPPPSPFPTELLLPELDDDKEIDSDQETVHYGYEDTTEINFVGIQRACVDVLEALLPTTGTNQALSPEDQRLATALGELLEASYQLETFHPSSAISSPASPPPEEGERLSPYLSLVHVLLAVETAATNRSRAALADAANGDRQTILPGPQAAQQLREDLAWARVESLSNAVIQLVRERDAPTRSLVAHALPPKYRRTDRESLGSEEGRLSCSSDGRRSLPPNYEDSHTDRRLYAEGSRKASTASVDVKDKIDEEESKSRGGRDSEKIMPILNELDTVTTAIERLQSMAPQMQDQRMPLRTAEARRGQSSSTPTERVRRRERELSDIWDKIERANAPRKYQPLAERLSGESKRRISGESGRVSVGSPRSLHRVRSPASPISLKDNRREAILADTMEEAVRKLDEKLPDNPQDNLQRARELHERDKFLRRLIESSSDARMSDQDAKIRPYRQQNRQPTSNGYAALGRLSGEQMARHSGEQMARRSGEQASRFSGEQMSRAALDSNDSLLEAVANGLNSGRLHDQDVPAPKRRSQRESFFSAVAIGTDMGRMTNQECAPPTPRTLRARISNDYADTASLHSTVSYASRAPSHDSNPFVEEDKEDFFEALLTSSAIGRLSNQEIEAPTPRTPVTALLTPNPNMTPASSRRSSFSLASPARPTSAAPSAIRKIAATFKGRGSTFGSTKVEKEKPPVVSTVDTSGAGYVAEHQENLRAIQVLLYGIPIDLAPDLQVEIVGPNDAALVSKTDQALRVSIALPSPVPLGQVVNVTPVDDFLEAKLSALPTPATTLSITSSITHALSAPNLRTLKPRSLCCTSCDREIAHFPPGVQFKDLPSEHWAEMLEVWMCHADPAFTASLSKHKDGFWPSEEAVLVGGSYLLVAGSHICDSNLTLEQSADADDWRIVACPCGEVLGRLRPEDGRPGAGTVRFSKWSIALLRGRGLGDVDHVRFPVSTFVVSDMLELAQAHASHRFLIADEQTGDRRLAIWVFNPSVRVAFKRPGQSLSLESGSSALAAAPPAPLRSGFERLGRSRRRPAPITVPTPDTQSLAVAPFGRNLRAAKIMYKVIEGSGPDAAYDNLPGFGPRGQVEHLRYPSNVCETLISALKASSALYPPQRRVMGSFDVGFLERI